MPVPTHIGVEARRCLARFRLPPGFQGRFPPRREPEPDAPSREPAISAAHDAAPSSSARSAARIAAALPMAASSGRSSAGASAQGPTTANSSMPPDLSHLAEGDLFSPDEIPVYQEYLQCIVRECMGQVYGDEEDVPDGAMTVSLLKHQVDLI
ncbi:unnamed protein product [Urochloa humidicola]